jgi:nucleotide-binding universal stress UspA family protein
MKVLLATDGSAHADAALNVVLQRPWPAKTEFKVISVLEPTHETLSKLFANFGKKASEAQARFREETQKIVEASKENLKAKFGDCSIDAMVLEGDPRKKIVEMATSWSADTVVLGSHGLENDSDLQLGSVAEYVLNNAHCTVEILKAPSEAIVLKETERNQPIEEDKYLVCVDDTEHSNDLVEGILSREWPKSSYFKVVTVIEPIQYAPHGIGPWQDDEMTAELAEQIEEAQREEAAVLVEGIVERISKKFPDSSVTAEVLAGEVRACLLDVARDWPADLMALGSHGRRGFIEAMLGSVSRAVATHAPCSVLVFKGMGRKSRNTSSAAATSSKA